MMEERLPFFENESSVQIFKVFLYFYNFFLPINFFKPILLKASKEMMLYLAHIISCNLIRSNDTCYKLVAGSNIC